MICNLPDVIVELIIFVFRVNVLRKPQKFRKREHMFQETNSHQNDYIACV